MQDQAEIRQALRDQRPQRRQYADVGGRERPYGKIAGAPVRRLLCEPSRMLDAVQNILRLAEKYSSGVRQRDVVAAAIEQLDADGSLEPPDLLAQRGLCRTNSCRRAREIQLFGDGHEVPQMPELDAGGEARFADVDRERSAELARVSSQFEEPWRSCPGLLRAIIFAEPALPIGPLHAGSP
ncbi:MAG TPA: hypothetical protein VMV37_01305 [Gammaproteobacteria bacterium]|nr:hypothetical protein [Gammaproteobacteria bacterium]